MKKLQPPPPPISNRGPLYCIMISTLQIWTHSSTPRVARHIYIYIYIYIYTLLEIWDSIYRPYINNNNWEVLTM